MTEHTELTAEKIDELQITLLRLAIKLGSDELEGKFARLCAQAKANVGAGGAVAYMHGDGTLYSKVRGESLLQSGAQNIEPLCRCKNPSTAQEALPEEPFGKNGMAEPRSTAAEIRSGMHNKDSEYIATMLECMADCIEEYRAHCLALKGA